MRFNEWWNKTGFTESCSLEEPDNELSPHDFALHAFNAGCAHGLAVSSNYIADREIEPTEVTFTNGRRVLIAKDHAQGSRGEPFLIVLMEPVSPVSET
jgi:hypothetical protein